MGLRLTLALVVVVARCLFGGVAMASTEIEEVVVTAQKRVSAIQDTPIAMTALSATAIEEQQIDGLREIQHIAPNLVLNSLGGTSNLYMRGIGTDINDSLAEPGVAMYVDGVYQGVTGDQSAIYQDLERIEVVRGPQGTLYGRNSTGGNVFLVTREPSFDPGIEASLLAGDYERMRASVVGTGGLVEDRLAARASVVVDQRDGVRDNEFDGGEVEELDLFSGALSFLYTPSEELEVLLRGNYGNREDDTPRWHYLEAVPGSGLGPLMFGGQPASHRGDIMNNDKNDYETETWGVSGTVTWELGVFTLKSISAYRESDWGGPYDNDGTDISFLTAVPDQTSEQWSQEIDLVGTAFDDRLDWILGIYYFQQDSMAEYTYELPAIQGLIESLLPSLATGTPPLPPGGLADPTLNPFWAPRVNTGLGSAVPFNDFHTEQDTESRAAFAQGTYHLTDRLRLTGGARYTSDSKDIVQSWHINFSPAGCRKLEQDADWDEATWKVGADFDLAEDVMVYANVSSGFHAGGFNGGSCGDEYDPETLLAYEVGVKSLFADRRAQLNLATFYYDYEDYQARLFIGGSALIQNAAKASITGAEVELLVRPIEGLDIEGNVAWLDAKFDQFESDNPMTPDTALTDLEDNELLRSPDISYNVSIQYEYPLGAGSVTGRYEASYKDDYYITIFNDDFAQIDSYTVQNARLIWRDGGRWQVQAFVENLTDERYLEAIVATPSAGGTLGMYALPRTWGIQVAFTSF